jgi:hypothetical protein
MLATTKSVRSVYSQYRRYRTIVYLLVVIRSTNPQHCWLRSPIVGTNRSRVRVGTTTVRDSSLLGCTPSSTAKRPARIQKSYRQCSMYLCLNGNRSVHHFSNRMDGYDTYLRTGQTIRASIVWRSFFSLSLILAVIHHESIMNPS